MSDEDRFFVLIVSGVRIVGWLVLGAVVVIVVHLMTGWVELIAGRETVVEMGWAINVSLGVHLATLVAIWRLLDANGRLRRRIHDLEHGRALQLPRAP